MGCGVVVRGSLCIGVGRCGVLGRLCNTCSGLVAVMVDVMVIVVLRDAEKKILLW